MMRWKCPRGLMSFLAGTIVPACAVHGQAITPDQIVRIDPDRVIVVSARPDPQPDVRTARRQARSITRAANIFDESLPLFHQPLCPGVAGLPVDLATFIADRIRHNAERIGLDLAAAGECEPNLVVAFVVDGRKAIGEMTRKRNSVIGPLPARERRALLREPGPVRSWIVWSLRSRDGMIVQEDLDRQYSVVRTQSANSLFLQASRKDIEVSAVVIDIPAIDGMSAVQIADYATMRGLARTRPVEGEMAYATILNLFDPQSPHPAELTMFDLAYLRALYDRPPNIAAAAKLGAVGSAMDKLRSEAGAADGGLRE